MRRLYRVPEVLLLHVLQLRDAQSATFVREQRSALFPGVACLGVVLGDRLDLRIIEVSLPVGGGKLGPAMRAQPLGEGERLGVGPAYERVGSRRARAAARRG